MKYIDFLNYHGCKDRKELAAKTGYSTVTLWKWETKGIPLSTQAVLQLKTNGKLQADINSLNAS